jgi:mannose-6-phosphate isomerase-like protein (cupin superfamily)
MTVINFSKIDYKKKRDRVYFKSVTGKDSQICLMKLEKGEKTDHSHENEQLGYVVSGEVDVFIGNETYTLKPGDAYRIPGNTRHGFHVKTENPVEYIEVFTPPKPENVY